ncbi:MAG: hypothetical protein A3I11_08370 [Elusimicrobia bacterium RIFCSPLOWO2_02_FULL_39_32]|nr:MAG: hypothetical protein A3B80_08635 [Elusimicrobia bacterium RIFCSPHIGHO2_02_FULL_39_36]OGR93184.1 MAG: hypothetical protein A3I11_08370 [Elusimicrobia bacterium RIFCSPLOWO2_02_FULL_39_32]OGR99409.1 MAG: hypothetical protein A3G85_06815 [Elusimicrobia bacterium RIFCSPLOWO2_12_FULL_39_28]
MNKILLLLILTFLGSGLNAKIYSEEDHAAHQGRVREFSIVAIEYRGTKVWVPGTLIVRKGDKVKITAINNINSDPNTHGFAIDEFGVKKVVARGEVATVEFTVDKEGLFTIYCQLHPAHIGGQLLVLKE